MTSQNTPAPTEKGDGVSRAAKQARALKVAYEQGCADTRAMIAATQQRACAFPACPCPPGEQCDVVLGTQNRPGPQGLPVAATQQATGAAPVSLPAREEVARIVEGSVIRGEPVQPFEGPASEIDWSSWDFADAILSLIKGDGRG